jgi:ribonuclease HI
MNKVITEIYTDGACSKNGFGGPGGWGVVVFHTDGSIKEFGGSNPSTTNNIQELTAVIEAYKYIRDNTQPEPITLYSDSSYVVKGVNEWMHSWEAKGWKKSDKKEILNLELWKDMYYLYNSIDLMELTTDLDYTPTIFLKLVKGHSGVLGNEMANKVATSYVIK